MRILVAVNGGVGSRVTGPEIRGWELARALRERHDITVAVHDPPGPERDGLRLVRSTRRELVREARRHDAVLAATVPPYLFTALRGTDSVVVSDQYDPVQLELSVFKDRPGIARVLEGQRLIRAMQLKFADLIVCAGERQRSLLCEELDDVAGRRTAPPEVVSVPFGVGEPPPAAHAGALRKRFPAIGAEDPVVLWWGKVWKWFDAATTIRAFARVVQVRPDARLVISAGKAPKQAFDRSANTADARALALALGLLDRNVFFLDEWVPYDRRHELLQDADLGVTLHAETAEAPFAARARYMDYLWAKLPCVLARGDEVAQRFGDAGFAQLVDPGSEHQTAAAILGLIEDRAARGAARRAAAPLASQYRWSTLVRPLAHAIEDRASHRRPAAAQGHPLFRAVGAYYLRRTLDHASSLGRPAGH